MQKAERTCINMLLLQESLVMYFLDGCNSDCSDWYLNLPVDELAESISKACPCVYKQSD